MNELLKDIEMGLMLAVYYIEDHSGDSNNQYEDDVKTLNDALVALKKLKDKSK